MKTIFLILLLLSNSIIAQQIQSNIIGVVNGPDKGKLRFYEINSRSGDEIIIDFEDHKFNYLTSNNEYLIYFLAFQSDVEDDGMWHAFPLILEDGDIYVSLDFDSIQTKSTISGGHQNDLSKEFNKMYLDFVDRFQKEDADQEALMKEFTTAVNNSINNNIDEFFSVDLIYEYHELFSPQQVNEFLEKIPEKYRSSKYYRKVYSKYFGKDRIAENKDYLNFSLPDKSGHPIKLSDIIRDNKLVLVDFWGSWCGPCIKKARQVKPLYDQFNSKGFEILGVALESNRQRWLDMLDKEAYKWPNVIEMEQDQNQKLVIVELYQVDGYPYGVLIDHQGQIISVNPSVEKLSEILKSKLE